MNGTSPVSRVVFLGAPKGASSYPVLFSGFRDDDRDDEPNAHSTCDAALSLDNECGEFDATVPSCGQWMVWLATRDKKSHFLT